MNFGSKAFIFLMQSQSRFQTFAPKGKKPAEYPSKPRKITQDTPEEREARAKREREKAIAFFKKMERDFKKKSGGMSANS